MVLPGAADAGEADEAAEGNLDAGDSGDCALEALARTRQPGQGVEEEGMQAGCLRSQGQVV